MEVVLHYVSLWFRADVKVSARQEHALFRVSADTSDTKDNTPNGVRLGLFFTCDADQNTVLRVQYSRMADNKQEFVQALPYVDERWVFASAGIDYANVPTYVILLRRASYRTTGGSRTRRR